MVLNANNILQERVRCAQDPVYYLNNYGYVFDAKQKKVSPMTCFEYQEKCVRDFHRFQNNIVLKSRQTGLSVVTAGYVAWKLMFRYDEKILIIANEGAGARRFLATVKQFIENTPKWLQPDAIITNNQTKLEFSNNSWVEAKASSPNAGRGESLTMLILDETAFIKDDQDIWMGAGMALSATKGKCIMISTPNGTGNLYHQTWVGALNKENDFNALNVHWTENPNSSVGLKWTKSTDGEIDIPWSPWYEEQCRRLGYDSVKIAQELDLSFEGSKYLAIEGALIEKYEKRLKRKTPPRFIKYDFLSKGTTTAGRFTMEETTFHVWKEPELGKKYILSADVSRGDGKDYSTIEVIDVESLEQVAEFRDKIGVDLFPYLIDWVGRVYNNAFVVVEANSFGLSVGFDLRDKFQYRNLFFSKNIQDIHVRPTDYRVPEGIEIPGFQTTKKTRPMLIKSIIEHMREGELIINSPRLLSEMKTFIMKGDRPEAEGGFNDDLIFAFGLGLYVRDTEYNNVSLSANMYKSMLDAFSVSSSSSVGYERDFAPKPNSDIPDVPTGGGGIFIGGGNNNNQDGQDDDFDWLLK